MTGSRDTATIIGLPRWKFFLPSVLLWALFVSAAVQSATLQDTFAIYPGYSDSGFAATGNQAQSGVPNYFGLEVGGSDVSTVVMKISTQPNPNQSKAVTYTISKVSSFSDFEDDFATGGTIVFIASGVNSVSALLLAGIDYVLKIDCSTCSNSHTSINASAVPLPAAAWLFGSALIGFIMMSNRRSV